MLIPPTPMKCILSIPFPKKIFRILNPFQIFFDFITCGDYAQKNIFEPIIIDQSLAYVMIRTGVFFI